MSTSIIFSCQTLTANRPPRPKREKIEIPENISPGAAKVIVYFALKLEEWEAREDLLEGVDDGGRD